MDSLIRTVHAVVERNVRTKRSIPEGKKLYHYIQFVTGKNNSRREDYHLISHENWYGYETIILTGKRGFVRLALTALFQEV